METTYARRVQTIRRMVEVEFVSALFLTCTDLTESHVHAEWTSAADCRKGSESSENGCFQSLLAMP